MLTRQMLLTFASGGVVVSLAGCSEEEPPGWNTSAETASPSTPSPESATGMTTDAETERPEQQTPSVSLSFDETYVDAGVEIIIERPVFDTSFGYDGEDYEMPDGQALVFAPVRFYNTGEESRRIDHSIFTLIADDDQYPETNSIDHPETDVTIDVHRLERGGEFGRWTSHGRGLEPGEEFNDVTVFVVPDGIEEATLSIYYDFERGDYADKIVVWSR